MKLNTNSVNVVLTVTCSLCFCFSLPIGVTTNYELGGGVGYLAFIETNLVFIIICVIFVVILGLVIGCGLKLINKLNKKLMHILCISHEFRKYYGAGVDRDNNHITNIDFTDNVRRSDDDELEMSNFPCQCKFKFQTESTQLQNADKLSEDSSSSLSPSICSSQNELRSDAVKEIENEIRQVENLLRKLDVAQSFDSEDLRFRLQIIVEADTRPVMLPNRKEEDLVGQKRLQTLMYTCEDMCPESAVQDASLKYPDNQLICPLKTECQNINSYTTKDTGKNEGEKLFRMEHKDHCSENGVSIEDPDKGTLSDKKYQMGTLENQGISVQAIAILSKKAQSYESSILSEIGQSVHLDTGEEPTINSTLTEKNLSEAVPSVDQQLSSSRNETSKDPVSHKTQCLENPEEKIYDLKSVDQNLSELRPFDDEQLSFKRNRAAQFEPVFTNLGEKIQDPKYFEHDLCEVSSEEQLSLIRNKASKSEAGCPVTGEIEYFQNIEDQILDWSLAGNNMKEGKTSIEEKFNSKENKTSKFEPDSTANADKECFHNNKEKISDVKLAEPKIPSIDEQSSSKGNNASKFENDCAGINEMECFQNVELQIRDSKPVEEDLSEVRTSTEEQLSAERNTSSKFQPYYAANDQTGCFQNVVDQIPDSKLVEQNISEVRPIIEEQLSSEWSKSSIFETDCSVNDDMGSVQNIEEQILDSKLEEQNSSDARPSSEEQLNSDRFKNYNCKFGYTGNDDISRNRTLEDRIFDSRLITQNFSEAMQSTEEELSFKNSSNSATNDEIENLPYVKGRFLNTELVEQNLSETWSSCEEQSSSGGTNTPKFDSDSTDSDEIESFQNLEDQDLDSKVTQNISEAMPSAEEQMSYERNRTSSCATTTNNEMKYIRNAEARSANFEEAKQTSSEARPSIDEQFSSKRIETSKLSESGYNANDEIKNVQNLEVQIIDSKLITNNFIDAMPSAEDQLSSVTNKTPKCASNDEIGYLQNVDKGMQNFEEMEQNSSEARRFSEEKLNSKRNKTLTNDEIEYNQNFEEQIPNFEEVEQNSSKSKPAGEEQLSYTGNKPLDIATNDEIQCNQNFEEQISNSNFQEVEQNSSKSRPSAEEQLTSKRNNTAEIETFCTAMQSDIESFQSLQEQIIELKLIEPILTSSEARSSITEELSFKRNRTSKSEPDFTANGKNDDSSQKLEKQILDTKLSEKNINEARTSVEEQFSCTRKEALEFEQDCAKIEELECFENIDEPIIDSKLAEQNLSEARLSIHEHLKPSSEYRAGCTAKDDMESYRSLQEVILDKKLMGKNLSGPNLPVDKQLISKRDKTSKLEPNCTATDKVECFRSLEEEILDKELMGKNLSGPKQPVDKQLISERNETSKLEPNCTITDEIECFRSLEEDILEKKQAERNLSEAKPSTPTDEQLSSERYKTSRLKPNCTANVEMECFKNLDEEILDKKQVEENLKPAMEEQLSPECSKLETNYTLSETTERFRGLEEQTQDPKLVEEVLNERRPLIVEKLISRENNISKFERSRTGNVFDGIQCFQNVEEQIPDSKDVEKDLSESWTSVDQNFSYQSNNTSRSETNEDMTTNEVSEQILDSTLTSQNLSEARSSEKKTLDLEAVKSAASPSVEDQIGLIQNRNSKFEAERAGNDDIEYFEHPEKQILDSKIVEQDLSEMSSTVDEQLRSNKFTSKLEPDCAANVDIEHIQKLEEQIHDSKLVDQNIQPGVEDQTQHNVIQLNNVTVCQNEVESQQEFSKTENVTRVENIYEVEIINRHLQQIINETTDIVNINNVNITNEYNVVESTNITTNENNTVIQRHETSEIQECISENVVNVTNLDTLTEISNNVHSTETYSAEQRNMYDNRTVRNSDSTFETTQDTKNIRETEIHVKSYIENRISNQEVNAKNLINFYNSRDDVDFRETSNLQNNESRIVNSTQQVINSDGVSFQNKELLGDNDIKKQDDLHEILVINHSGSNAVNTGEYDSMKTDTTTKDLPISLERRPLDTNISEDITKLANIGRERVTDEEIQTPFKEDNADGQENTKSRQHLTERTKYDNKQNQNTFIDEKRFDEIVFDNFLSETSRTPENKIENNSKETEEDTIKLQQNSELKLTIHASENKSTPAEDMHLEHRKEYSTLPVVDTNSTISEETNANPSSKKQPRKICLGLSHCSKRIKINLRTDNV